MAVLASRLPTPFSIEPSAESPLRRWKSELERLVITENFLYIMYKARNKLRYSALRIKC